MARVSWWECHKITASKQFPCTFPSPLTANMLNAVAPGWGRYLGDVEVEAKALPLPLHLPHAQLAGELAGAEAEALQSERAVQVPVGTVPDVVERDLLQEEEQAAQSGAACRNKSACLEYTHTSSLTRLMEAVVIAPGNGSEEAERQQTRKLRRGDVTGWGLP